LQIDECQRLWVIDTGKIGMAESTQLCSPKILVFDLGTNRVLRRYTIPRGQYTDTSLLVTPVSGRRNKAPSIVVKNISVSRQVIDVSDPSPGNCANSKAYIADVTGFSIIVYDSLTDSSWRIQNSEYDDECGGGSWTRSRKSFQQ
jgi:Major royal jelly protein